MRTAILFPGQGSQTPETRDRVAALRPDLLEFAAEALTAPVRWRETVLALPDAGVERFVDAGPGQMLAGLVKRIARSAEPVSV